MQAREKKRARRLVTLLTSSPWLMIALGLHVIVGAWISVVTLQQERAPEVDVATAIAVGTHREEPAPNRCGLTQATGGAGPHAVRQPVAPAGRSPRFSAGRQGVVRRVWQIPRYG